MIEITPCGTFLDIDSNSYVLKKAQQKLIQHEWQTIINETIGYYKETVDGLISVYVRGSVAKGIAVEHVSDLDSFFISKEKVRLKDDQQELFLKNITEKYPFCLGVELFGGTEQDIAKKREDGAPSLFHELIKTQSVCVYGKDHSSELPPIKLSEMSGPLKSLNKTFEITKEELKGNTDKEDIKDLCTWIMKKILRSGFQKYQDKEQKWTRDLYLCYDIIKKYQPENEKLLTNILHLCLNPTDEPQLITRILEQSTNDLSLFN